MALSVYPENPHNLVKMGNFQFRSIFLKIIFNGALFVFSGQVSVHFVALAE